MEAIELLGVGELMPSNAFMQLLADVACSEGSVLQPMCENILFLLVGYDPSQLNETLLPVILSHTLAGCSIKTVAHYAQEISAVEGGFRLWDFYAGNLAEYGSLFPPSYDLAAISTPVSLFYSDNDLFGDPTDVHELNTALGNSLGEYRVPLSSFAHMDFLWANDVKTLVNDEVLETIQNN
ncbi:lipase 3-like [Periplaneta americana]|uniref:lipase 3-like n=1 Tax=Periplaneta americana TaxID=6978 RepID=UPI0037E99CA3